MKFRVSYVTNLGTSRSGNQDSLLLQSTLLNRVSMDAPATLEFEAEKAWFIVADGLGGEAAGDEASGETLQILRDGLPGIAGRNDLEPLLGKARQRLDQIARERNIRLGTTLAGLYISPGESFVFNVGDCRVYKVKAGFLNRLTRDHSLLEMAAQGGSETVNVAKNIVTSAVMGGDTAPMEVYSRTIPNPAKDTFLLCCDGLWGPVPIEELEAGFKAPSSGEALSLMLKTALAKGDDNISGIVVSTG